MEILIVFALLLGFEVLLGCSGDGIAVALVEGRFSLYSISKGIGIASEKGLCSGLIGFSSRAGVELGKRVRIGRGMLNVVREGEVYAELPGTLGWAGDEFIVFAASKPIIKTTLTTSLHCIWIL
ncbi:hypothetical protein BGX38DRAFT_1156087 [Terfezia claveryi]|nr:hypothetical protein BGX38DRAFT_1156087 [Terfezia claveryi]